jgi:hypothetical protein
MKVTLFSELLIVSMFAATTVFANQHMHVNHDHEHTLHQPAVPDKGNADRTAPTATTHANNQTTPGNN